MVHSKECQHVQRISKNIPNHSILFYKTEEYYITKFSECATTFKDIPKYSILIYLMK